MTSKFSEVNNSFKEFYYYLGLISTKFAILEYNTLSILSRLIIDNFVLTNTILERNSLSQNIELLKRINLHKRFEEKSVSGLIAKISNVRKTRNLFIHGIWGEPSESKNDSVIFCGEPKILYEENENGRSWASKRNHQFTLNHLKKQVRNIDEILLIQDYLINELNDYSDYDK